MASDIDYDRFDYHSTQDEWEIEYQIDRFELRQSCKSRSQQRRRKTNKSAHSISMKSLKCNPQLVKEKCMHDKRTVKAQPKPFRRNRYPQAEPIQPFECDEELQVTQADSSNSETLIEAKPSNDDSRKNFSAFRRHFYRLHQQQIKSDLDKPSYTKVIDIRCAPVDASVQNQFLMCLNNNSFPPDLTYLGTRLINIARILRYGFLVPNEAHPTNEEPPISQSANGIAYGQGIYCSMTAGYPVLSMEATNTLLVCATLPPRDGYRQFGPTCGNSMLLCQVDQIIPLFLVDIEYTVSWRTNRTLYMYTRAEKSVEKTQKPVRMPVEIPKRHLRKVLALINDDKRKNHPYQVRRFE